MNQPRRFLIKSIAGIFFLLLISSLNFLFASDGKTVYATYCQSCHKPDKDFTGPALKGARDRQAKAGLPKDWVFKWVHNTTSMVKSDPYAKQLFEKAGGQTMTQFGSEVTNEDITAVLDWADSYKEEKPPLPPGEKQEDNSLLYGLLTLILGVIGLLLLQVNSNLKKLSDEKQGIRAPNPVPFYRNKAYLLLGVL